MGSFPEQYLSPAQDPSQNSITASVPERSHPSMQWQGVALCTYHSNKLLGTHGLLLFLQGILSILNPLILVLPARPLPRPGLFKHGQPSFSQEDASFVCWPLAGQVSSFCGLYWGHMALMVDLSIL